MNETQIEIIIFAIVGLFGIIAHGFKATHDRNKIQEAEYTFGMYFKKNRYIMYFVAICIIVFAYYENEWSAFEKLGNWRGLIMFGLGYMGDSAFPSLLGLITLITDKIKGTKNGEEKKEEKN